MIAASDLQPTNSQKPLKRNLTHAQFKVEQYLFFLLLKFPSYACYHYYFADKPRWNLADQTCAGQCMQ